jgi:hypothetical protein
LKALLLIEEFGQHSGLERLKKIAPSSVPGEPLGDADGGGNIIAPSLFSLNQLREDRKKMGKVSCIQVKFYMKAAVISLQIRLEEVIFVSEKYGSKMRETNLLLLRSHAFPQLPSFSRRIGDGSSTLWCLLQINCTVFERL